MGKSVRKPEFCWNNHPSCEYISGIYLVNIYQEHQDIIAPVRKRTHPDSWAWGYRLQKTWCPSQEQNAQEGFLKEKKSDPSPERGNRERRNREMRGKVESKGSTGAKVI